MHYLYGFIIMAIIGLIYMRYEAGTVKIEKVKFTSNKEEGLKIIQLSDIHIKLLKVPINVVSTAIKKENPDVIILTGDYIERPDQINDFLSFLDRVLDKRADTYLCFGNHDYDAFKKCSPGSMLHFLNKLEDLGITVLHNKAVCYTKNSVNYNLIGIEDINRGKPDIEKALSYCYDKAFLNIAFSHNPDVVFLIPEGKIDFLFCGHFHGGQIWFPLNMEARMLRKEILCKMGVTRGLYRINGIKMYINRGLGNVCFPLRFFSKPEITVFYLP